MIKMTKSWKKENTQRMIVTYTFDKYKEADDYEDTFRIIEGTLAYVNMPMANSFLNIRDAFSGKIISIAFGLILKIEWDTMPKWTQLTESQVVDSATMRLKNLDNELEIQRNNMSQQEELSKMLDKSSVSESN
tara:strand:- start:6260 stop:6658 length:399 start_codon:yes stop_codon:yes gene_type:complete